MQVIFYHNKSGEAAYTGELKTKEVHKAITLHPVKQPEYLYKLHTYIQASYCFSADLGLVNWHIVLGYLMGYKRPSVIGTH